MIENGNYIEIIKDKLTTLEDKELVSLINRLIDERYKLIEDDRTDTLTGLNNRRILSHVDNFSGILLLDVDNFKQINDTFGHDVGDIVLKNIADILKNSIRSDDHVCRIGGDEFVIIFNRCPENVIVKRAEEIRTAVEGDIDILSIPINVSIGIAINDNEEDLSEMLKKADVALYESKENGKNQITEFNHLEEKHFVRVLK